MSTDILYQNIRQYILVISVKSKYQYIRNYRYFYPWSWLIALGCQSCWLFPCIGQTNQIYTWNLAYGLWLFLWSIWHPSYLEKKLTVIPFQLMGKFLQIDFLFANLTMWTGLLKVILILMFHKWGNRMYGEVNLNYSWLHMFSSESLSPSCLLSPSPECLCVCIFHLLFFFFFWFYNWNALVWSKKLWKNIYPHESNTCLMNKYWSQFLRSCLLAILVHLIQCRSAIIFPVLSFGFAYLGASSPFKKNIIKLRTLNWHEPEVLITAGCRSQSTCMIRILVA